jgi:hypothetical protein
MCDVDNVVLMHLFLYCRIESEHNKKVIVWVAEEIPPGDYNQRDIKR